MVRIIGYFTQLSLIREHKTDPLTQILQNCKQSNPRLTFLNTRIEYKLNMGTQKVPGHLREHQLNMNKNHHFHIKKNNKNQSVL